MTTQRAAICAKAKWLALVPPSRAFPVVRKDAYLEDASSSGTSRDISSYPISRAGYPSGTGAGMSGTSPFRGSPYPARPFVRSLGGRLGHAGHPELESRSHLLSKRI